MPVLHVMGWWTVSAPCASAAHKFFIGCGQLWNWPRNTARHCWRAVLIEVMDNRRALPARRLHYNGYRHHTNPLPTSSGGRRYATSESEESSRRYYGWASYLHSLRQG